VPLATPESPALAGLARQLAESATLRWWREAAPEQADLAAVSIATSPHLDTQASRLEESSGWETLPTQFQWSLLDTADSQPFVASVLNKSARSAGRSGVTADPAIPARVRSIVTPRDWVQICRTYPQAIAPAEKDYWQDWLSGMVKERIATVVVPDWEALRRDWDALYLSPWGYATCEGRVIQAGGDWFFLVGWEPCMLLMFPPKSAPSAPFGAI